MKGSGEAADRTLDNTNDRTRKKQERRGEGPEAVSDRRKHTARKATQYFEKRVPFSEAGKQRGLEKEGLQQRIGGTLETSLKAFVVSGISLIGRLRSEDVEDEAGARAP